ncbi:MAG: flippase-like domain-containing protein [Cyanobacteria bacterium]|nr:flippase-like domain-containing protein [Cyanobacteriota bacterium]
MNKYNIAKSENITLPSSKDRIFNFSRILISLLLLLFIILLNYKHFSLIFNSILNVKILYIILASVTCMVSLFFESLRWNVLLRAQNKKINAGYLFVLIMTGFFYSNILPSNIGGDLYRVYDINKNKKIPLNISASSVFLERFFGFISIVIYFLITSFSIYRIMRNYVITITIFLSIALVLFLIIIKPEFFKIDRLFKKFKKLGRLEKKFNSFKDVLNSYKDKIPYLVSGFILNIIADTLIMVMYYFVSISLGLNLNFISFMFIVPVIFVFTAIPISIGGLGVRENTIVFMLTRFGISGSDAVAFSLFILFVFILNAIAGGVIYLFKNIFFRLRTII